MDGESESNFACTLFTFVDEFGRLKEINIEKDISDPSYTTSLLVKFGLVWICSDLYQ